MAPKRKAATAATPVALLTDKQAFLRDRTRFHTNAGESANAAAKLGEKEWQQLGNAVAKAAAAVLSRQNLAGVAVAAPAGGDANNPVAGPPTKIAQTVDRELAKDRRKLAAAAVLADFEGRHWKGQQYLGGGAYGHAHLYLELDKADRITQRLVVKDSWADTQWSEVSFWWGDVRDPTTRLPVEIKCMDLTKNVPGSEVLVQLRHFIVYPEKRSFRLYMSYAGQGDLEAVRNLYPAATIRLTIPRRGRNASATATAAPHKYVPEAAIWSIFQQLNQACLVMEYGSADETTRPDEWRQIVHRDLKTDNIFLDVPGNGEPYPRCVLGDFGMGLITSEDDELNPLFYGDDFGTEGYKAPEQVLRFNTKTFDPQPLAKQLAWTNIWAVGATLARIMRGKRVNKRGEFDEAEYRPKYEKGPEVYKWFDTGVEGAYSSDLRELVLNCLEYEPTARPTNENIRDEIRRYLEKNPLSADPAPLETKEDLYKIGMTFTGTMVGEAN